MDTILLREEIERKLVEDYAEYLSGLELGKILTIWYGNVFVLAQLSE